MIKLLGRASTSPSGPAPSRAATSRSPSGDYTHSTAPNRRFPDLVTQRLLKAALAGTPAPYTLDGARRRWPQHCTTQEDAANKVERLMQKAAAALLARRRGSASVRRAGHRRRAERARGCGSARTPVEGTAGARRRGARRRRPRAGPPDAHRPDARVHRLRTRVGTVGGRQKAEGSRQSKAVSGRRSAVALLLFHFLVELGERLVGQRVFARSDGLAGIEVQVRQAQTSGAQIALSSAE